MLRRGRAPSPPGPEPPPREDGAAEARRRLDDARTRLKEEIAPPDDGEPESA